MDTLDGPQPALMRARYDSGSSRFSFRMPRLITWKRTSIGRTFSTSRIQREVTQANGQVGSNQKSACDRTVGSIVCTV